MSRSPSMNSDVSRAIAGAPDMGSTPNARLTHARAADMGSTSAPTSADVARVLAEARRALAGFRSPTPEALAAYQRVRDLLARHRGG